MKDLKESKEKSEIEDTQEAREHRDQKVLRDREEHKDTMEMKVRKDLKGHKDHRDLKDQLGQAMDIQLSQHILLNQLIQQHQHTQLLHQP